MKRFAARVILVILGLVLALPVAWTLWSDHTLKTLSNAPFMESVKLVDGVGCEVSMVTYQSGVYSVVELGKTRLVVPHEFYMGRYSGSVMLTMERGGWADVGLGEHDGHYRTDGNRCTYRFRGHVWVIDSGVLSFPGFQIDLTREQGVILIGANGAPPRMLHREVL